MPQVPLNELRPRVDPSIFSFQTTEEVPPHIGLIGQDRAVEAIKFGLAMEGIGFNICVAGEPGTGRTTAIREYLEQFARTKAPPDEWVYVNNFADPHQPRAIQLPKGMASLFRTGMAAMVLRARERIPRTFQSDDYVARRDEIVGSVQRHHEEVFSRLADQARAGGFQLQGNAGGFFLVPIAGGKPMEDQTFAALGEEERESIRSRRDALMEQLRAVMKQEQTYDADATQRVEELERTVAAVVVDSLLEPLLSEFHEFTDVVRYLTDVRTDMVEHIADFIPPSPQQQAAVPPAAREVVSPLRRYEVNLLVDCTQEQCATVVFETNPTPQRLFGRIEKEALFGAVTTDFTMIRAGSLHQANGGYFVFDFDQLLLYPLSWIEMKRMIRTAQLTIEEMGDRLGYIETKTIRPEPIPWTGKIIGIARDEVYRTLYAGDPDFRELFKVKADFDLHIDRTLEHEMDYAGLIASVTKHERLLPFDRGAVARVIEQGMRLAEDHSKLSIRFGELTDVVRESAHWAKEAGASVVTAAFVRQAIEARILRVSLVGEHIREAITKGIILVDTTGTAIGQVNGLSVIDLGDSSFGQPSRITATIGVGREGIFDLQREAHLSGPIHSKAVLTLQGFLVDRYASMAPLTLAARVAFEQSYGMIEGDSATVAETCALLSRIANLPLKQSFAITGSMDQRGEVQAIGGANQKIEGFFDVCHERGLTGEQGVVIPATNVQHLMLREDVVEAVQQGQFSIHSIATIDDALELLMGVPAGERDADGNFPPETVNGRVQARLKQISERLRESGVSEAQMQSKTPSDAKAMVEVQPE